MTIKNVTDSLLSNKPSSMQKYGFLCQETIRDKIIKNKKITAESSVVRFSWKLGCTED